MEHYLPQKGFSGHSAVKKKKKKKKSTFNAGNTGSVLDSGRSPGGGNGHLFRYSCLRNAMEGRPWWAKIHGVAESDITCPLWTETTTKSPSKSTIPETLTNDYINNDAFYEFS